MSKKQIHSKSLQANKEFVNSSTKEQLEKLMKPFDSYEIEQCDIHGVINCPDELEPVLAKIEHINSFGKSNWYEVVYFDENWRCYSGSNTFKDGEKVIKWKYCKGCL